MTKKTNKQHAFGVFQEPSLGPVRPGGWLQVWLKKQADGLTGHLEAAGFPFDTLNGFKKLDKHHMLVTGAPSSSENLRGRTALDSHETCDIADYTWAAGYLLQATGDVDLADKIERACFNAHPAAVTKDFHQLQYFSCPNQVVLRENSCHALAVTGEKWMCYAPKLHPAAPDDLSQSVGKLSVWRAQSCATTFECGETI